MTGSPPLLAQFDQVSSAVSTLLSQVHDDQWSRRTPCPDWTVRQLVGHVIAGNQRFAAAARETEHTPAVDLDAAAGEDPAATFADSVSEFSAALSDPDALSRTYASPVGSVPGPVLIHLRMVEHLVHGWDLSRATGLSLVVDEELVEQELDFTRVSLDNVEAARRPFALPQDVPADASILDRLAALLGRDVEDD